MSETKLKKLIDDFLEDFWDLRLMDDVAIREPKGSKHQRKLRQLCDMVRAFEYAVQKHEGKKN